MRIALFFILHQRFIDEYRIYSKFRLWIRGVDGTHTFKKGCDWRSHSNKKLSLAIYHFHFVLEMRKRFRGYCCSLLWLIWNCLPCGDGLFFLNGMKMLLMTIVTICGNNWINSTKIVWMEFNNTGFVNQNVIKFKIY